MRSYGPLCGVVVGEHDGRQIAQTPKTGGVVWLMSQLLAEDF